MTGTHQDVRPAGNGAAVTTPNSHTVARHRPAAGGAWRRTWALALVELRLLFRRPVTTASAILLPLVLVGMTFIGERPDSPGRWGATLGQHATLALLITVYLTTATVLTTRRQTLVFKRLRTSELSAPGLLLSVVAPVALLGAGQLGIVVVVHLATGAPAPQDPGLVVAGLVLGLVLAVAAAGLTAAVTANAEAVQFAVVPLVLGASIGSQIVTGAAFSPQLEWAALAVPLVALSDLVHKGWAGPAAGVAELPQGLPVVPVDLVLLVGWAAIAAALFVRTWRWDPRS